MKSKSLITGLKCDIYVFETESCFSYFEVSSTIILFLFCHFFRQWHILFHLAISVGNAFNVDTHLISFTPKVSSARLHSSLLCPRIFIFFCYPRYIRPAVVFNGMPWPDKSYSRDQLSKAFLSSKA